MFLLVKYYYFNLYYVYVLFVIVLAEDAIKAALSDYRIKQQEKKKAEEGQWLDLFGLLYLFYFIFIHDSCLIYDALINFSNSLLLVINYKI